MTLLSVFELRKQYYCPNMFSKYTVKENDECSCFADTTETR